MTYNMNSRAKVKLTPKGYRILGAEAPYLLKEVGDDGCLTVQLWCLFDIFGDHISIGFSVPFETEIELEPFE